MPHLNYCSMVWHHFLKSDSKKLDQLHKQGLRYLYNDQSSELATLTDRIGYSLADRRIRNIAFKTINNFLLNAYEIYMCKNRIRLALA